MHTDTRKSDGELCRTMHASTTHAPAQRARHGNPVGAAAEKVVRHEREVLLQARLHVGHAHC